MKSLTNVYDLSQPSVSNKPGFDAFKSENNQRFYFHFNDPSGAPLLFSQAYNNAEARDKGIQSVVKNGRNESKFEEKTDESGLYFFILKAGNNQEIGRSKNFRTPTDLESGLRFIKSFLLKGAPVETKPFPTIRPDVPPATERLDGQILKPIEETKYAKFLAYPEGELPVETPGRKFSDHAEQINDSGTHTLPRHVFRLEFYSSGEAALIGKITHPFSDQVKMLTGIDGKAIAQFIEDRIQSFQPASAGVSKSGVGLFPLPGSLPAEKKMLELGTEENIELLVHDSDQYTYLVDSENALLLSLKIKAPKNQEEINGFYSFYTASIYAHPIEKSGARVLLLQDEALNKLDEKGTIKIFTNILPPGAHRIVVRCRPKLDNARAENSENPGSAFLNKSYMGSRLIQLS